MLPDFMGNSGSPWPTAPSLIRPGQRIRTLKIFKKRSTSLFLTGLLLAALPMTLSCKSEKKVESPADLECDSYKTPQFPGGDPVYVHLLNPEDSNPTVGGVTQSGDGFSFHPTVEAMPIRVSEQYHDRFLESLAHYGAGDLTGAYHILLELLGKEPDNLFFLQQMAATTYRMGKNEESLQLHLLLMERIKNLHPEIRGEIVDLWFLDSYYRLGTLYLDKKDWDQAILNIRKIYDFSSSPRHPGKEHARLLLEQAAGFLTEATFHNKDRKANHYYYCQTLSLDRENTYIAPYLLP